MQVPVIVLHHFSETQKRAYTIADNRLALNAGWDDDLLRCELEELDKADYNFAFTGFDDEELAQLPAQQRAAEGLTDEDAVPELTPEVEDKRGPSLPRPILLARNARRNRLDDFSPNGRVRS